MTTDAATARNKRTIERLFLALRAGDTGALDALIADDYVQHNLQQATTCSPSSADLTYRR